MPTNDEGQDGSCSYIALDGKEFAVVSARRVSTKIDVEHFIHVAGKDFDDARLDLKAHIDSTHAIAQISAPVTILDAGTLSNPEELANVVSQASGLAADNMVIAYADKATGTEKKSGEGHENTLAIAINKSHLCSKKADLASLGVPNAKITIRAINAIGAIKTAIKRGDSPTPVLCVSVMGESSQLFIVSDTSVVEIGQIDVGYLSILPLIMSELNLKFEGSAARLFFGNIYDFEDKGDCLAAPFISKIRTKIETYAGTHPAGVVLCGLPPARASLLAKHIAVSINVSSIRLKTIFDSDGISQATMQVVGSPEFAHTFESLLDDDETPSTLIDFSKIPFDIVAHWRNICTEHHDGFIRMYRGTAIDENGNPVEIHNVHKTKSENPEPIRKIARMYRGTPIYEDELESVHDSAKLANSTDKDTCGADAEELGSGKHKDEKKLRRMYRGTPV